MFFIGSPKMEIEGNSILVKNIRADILIHDLNRGFKSTRFANNIFSAAGRSYFKMPLFFAMELYRAIKIVTENRYSTSSYRSLTFIKEALIEKTWVGEVLDENQTRPDVMNFSKISKLIKKPMDHQLEFLHLYNVKVAKFKLNGIILNSAAGTGKTLMGFYWAECLETDMTIILTINKAVDLVWGKTLREEFHETPEHWTNHMSKPFEGEKYSVWNYEAIGKLKSMLKLFKGKSVSIILDESHKLNEIKTLRAEIFEEICKELNVKHILWASGTPLKAMATESIPILRSLDPLFTKSVEKAYRKMVAGNKPRIMEVISERINDLMVTFGKEVIQINPPTFINVPVKAPGAEQYTLSKVKVQMADFVKERVEFYKANMSNYVNDFNHILSILEDDPKVPKADLSRYKTLVRQISPYNGMIREVKEEVEECNRIERRILMPLLEPSDRKVFKEAASVVKYVTLKIQGEALGRILTRERVNATKLLTEHFPYEKIFNATTMKTTVFSTNTDVVKHCMAKLESEGMQPIAAYGDKDINVDNNVNAFMTDPKVNPIVATFATLSTAVPLTAADSMILLNAPPRDYILQQVVSRIHRINGASDTFIYTAVLDTGTEQNITTRGVDILKWSQEQVELITGIKSPFAMDSEDGLGTVMEDILDVKFHDFMDDFIYSIDNPDFSLKESWTQW